MHVVDDAVAELTWVTHTKTKSTTCELSPLHEDGSPLHFSATYLSYKQKC
jgi:hypothetical protein